MLNPDADMLASVVTNKRLSFDNVKSNKPREDVVYSDFRTAKGTWASCIALIALCFLLAFRSTKRPSFSLSY